MADHHSSNLSFGEKHYFYIRRLHSLCGLVPVGAFLCFHLIANASILAPGVPGESYQKAIEQVHVIGPLLVPVEIIFIFIPILFHALLGVQIWLTSKPNAQQYRYGSNIRYMLQRATGMFAFAFILYHLWHMHWLGAGFGGGHFQLHNSEGGAAAAASTAAAIQSAWWIAPFYALGVVASVYHLANGVWTSLITWGITIRPEAQRVSGYACAVLGVVLTIAGLGAVRAFQTFESGRTTVVGAQAVHTVSEAP